jgi:hypothetical protein
MLAEGAVSGIRRSENATISTNSDLAKMIVGPAPTSRGQIPKIFHSFAVVEDCVEEVGANDRLQKHSGIFDRSFVHLRCFSLQSDVIL